MSIVQSIDAEISGVNEEIAALEAQLDGKRGRLDKLNELRQQAESLNGEGGGLPDPVPTPAPVPRPAVSSAATGRAAGGDRQAAADRLWAPREAQVLEAIRGAGDDGLSPAGIREATGLTKQQVEIAIRRLGDLDGVEETVREVGAALEVEHGVPAVARRKFFDVLAELSLDEALEAAFAAAAPPSIDLAGDPEKGSGQPHREEAADQLQVLRCIDCGEWAKPGSGSGCGHRNRGQLHVAIPLVDFTEDSDERTAVLRAIDAALESPESHSERDDLLAAQARLRAPEPPAGREEAPELGELAEVQWPDGETGPRNLVLDMSCPNCGSLTGGHKHGCTDTTPCIESVEVVPASMLAEKLGREEALREALEGVIERCRATAPAIPGSGNALDAGAKRAANRIADDLQAILDSNPSPASGEANGAALIAAERARQAAEGWTPEHDDQHDQGELAQAGAAYALVAGAGPTKQATAAERIWPFADGWKPSDDEIRNLVKAGALLAAEIDRLQREAGQ